MKRSPIRAKRPGTRRGELTPAEKEAVRRMAYDRARGRCELDAHLHCCGGVVLPWGGGHLVHLRSKRRFGWGENNVAWGCPHGHLDLNHTKGIPLPKTYDELKGVKNG
jgi:hypothetical protein